MEKELREHRIKQICATWKSVSYTDKCIMKHALETFVGPDTKSIIDALSKMTDDDLEIYYDDTIDNYGAPKSEDEVDNSTSSNK